MKFEIKDRDAAGRLCKLKTNHGTITTPNLMPVINPNKLIISPKEMKNLFGTEIVITNSYIINKSKNLSKKSLANGVHKLIDFDGPIMTDSGTFQSYVYGDVDVDPIEIIKFQRDIGSDIGTILDVFGTPSQTKKEALKGVKETIERAKRSIFEKGDMNLACTIQGSIYPELRLKCAKELSKIDSDFFPIGGVVPLMENQRYTDLVKCILASKKGLDPSKPVHLFGAGHPLIFPIAVALGCDLFDSSAYIKYAADDRLIFDWGTEILDNISETPCNCPVCSKYSAEDLKKMPKENRIKEIAKHNLYVSFLEIKKIRNAITQGSLWELVERRANSNPYLLEALKELRKKNNKIWLEKFEQISKKRAVFYTGPQTLHRPLIYRQHERLKKRYNNHYKKIILMPEAKKPYFSHYSRYLDSILENGNTNCVVSSHLGPVPIELDEMYPFAQSIFPLKIDIETKKLSEKLTKNFLNDKEVEKFEENKIANSPEIDIRRIKSVADMQFGHNVSKTLMARKIKLVKSKKTHKIRNIYLDNKHILSMRAEDGLFSLKIEGAKIFHNFVKSPFLRVVVDNDAAQFIKDGKSVFSKFVKECDPELRPLDECLIVDEKDNLLAVGRCLLNRQEMLSFNYGMAVKTRESILK